MKAHTANIVLAIGGLTSFVSTEVQNSTFVFRLKFSAKNPAHRQSGGTLAAIVSVRLYKTNLGVILIFANAFFMIVPILFLYLISKGFCVIC